MRRTIGYSLPILLALLFSGVHISGDVHAAVSGETARDVYRQTEHQVSGPPAPALQYPGSYGTGRLDHRSLLWIFIQQHFFLGSFILGVPMIAWMLELSGQAIRLRNPARAARQDRLAQEIMRIALPFYSFSVFTGVALLLVFLFSYGAFFRYMTQLFKPAVLLYAVCFLSESLLIYAYTLAWERWSRGEKKWAHMGLGALTCANGILIIALANAWMSFMMSPAGVDAQGRYLGSILAVVQTPFWYPLNLHRILASIMFSGAVLAAHAAYRMLTTTDPAQKAHYDRMGHVMIMISMANLLLLPFAGYWFAKVIFIFRQRMGVTLMGGGLSWPFVIQAMLIGLIFMTMTYYLWQGTARMRGAERYAPLVKYLFLVLCVSVMVWSTPHTLPASQGEFGAMGGTQHPVVGNYGTMAAKNTAINTMILTFGLGLMIFRRCNKEIVVPWRRWGNAALVALFVGAELNLIALGVYGHSIPANVRVGLALPQFLSALSALLVGGAINGLMLRGARKLGPIRWGTLPLPGAFALFALALLISMTMSLMGYIRSSVRLTWHITEIMEDVTPWAQTPGIPYAIGMVLLNVALFALIAAFIFRMGKANASVPAEVTGSAQRLSPEMPEPGGMPSL